MNNYSLNWLRAAVLYLLLVGVLSMPAHSDQYSEPMTFEIHTTDTLCPECTTISAVGVIQATTAEAFRTFLRKHTVPTGSLVDFNSPGGSLLGGTELGLAIRANNFRTSVGMKAPAKDKSCASACTYAFLGGVSRIVHPDSHFGIHQFYGEIGSEDGLGLAQDIIAELLEYVSNMGISTDFVKVASGTSANEMTWLDAAQRSTLRVTTQDFIDGGSVWQVDSKKIAAWKVQENGRVVHFDFGCPQLVLSIKEEAEIREQLATRFSPVEEIDRIRRKSESDRLRWSQQYRLDVHYFEHRDEPLEQQCSLSTATGGFQCAVKGTLTGGIPIEFSADLPWSTFSGYHFDFYGMSRFEKNTVRLRTELSKEDFERIVDQSVTDAPIEFSIEPDVTYRGERMIDKLASTPVNLALPKQGLAKAGGQLLAACESYRQ